MKEISAILRDILILFNRLITLYVFFWFNIISKIGYLALLLRIKPSRIAVYHLYLANLFFKWLKNVIFCHQFCLMCFFTYLFILDSFTLFTYNFKIINFHLYISRISYLNIIFIITFRKHQFSLHFLLIRRLIWLT